MIRFKCLNEAKCEYKDGKCQWLQTSKFKKCLYNHNKKITLDSFITI